MKKNLEGGSMKNSRKIFSLQVCLIGVVVLLIMNVSYAFKARTELSKIEKLEFVSEELYVSQITNALQDVLCQLPNKAVWEQFIVQHKNAHVFIDPRSGRPSTIITVIPIIPGMGDNNSITLKNVSLKVGYNVDKIGTNEVKQLILRFIGENTALLGIKMDEIGEVRIGNPVDYLWDIFIKREIQGIPVRNANLNFSINHGNLVIWGVESWGDIDVSLVPAVSKEEALNAGFAYIGGRKSGDMFVEDAHLELVPVAPSTYTGVPGTGYSYHLVWAFTFQREGYANTWEILIDAHTRNVMSFQDQNQYVLKKIVGAIYPVSSDECCPDGCAASLGMPHMNTGLAAPNNYTSLNGTFDWTSGTVTTTLDSRYVTLNTDNCGSVNETSAPGDIDLGGTNG